MRTLTLVRHAKSSWKDINLSDYDRPLNKRGKRDLPLLCQRLQAQDIRPDLILYSPALRTKITAEQIHKHLNLPKEHIEPCLNLYEASEMTLLSLIQRTAPEKQHLMLVGHNPGLENLANLLLGNALSHFPTTAVVHMIIDLNDWSSLSHHHAKCSWFDYPKLHQD